MKLAVVSGSFDPLTKGHLYVIEQAKKMAEKVLILIATNPDKKYCLTPSARMNVVEHGILEHYGAKCGIQMLSDGVIVIEHLYRNVFTALEAKQRGADAIVRGLRNVVDFEYEHGMQLVNDTIAPEVTTIFVMPPPNLIAVSSSAIRGMVGVEGWEQVAEQYVPQVAIKALKGEPLE